MLSVPTYTAAINCGLREGYGGPLRPEEDVLYLVRDFVEQRKLGVTVSPTRFLYPGGEEPGVVVGLCIHPQRPVTPGALRDTARDLARLLRRELKQERVFVVCPDVTIIVDD